MHVACPLPVQRTTTQGVTREGDSLPTCTKGMQLLSCTTKTHCGGKGDKVRTWMHSPRWFRIAPESTLKRHLDIFSHDPLSISNETVIRLFSPFLRYLFFFLSLSFFSFAFCIIRCFTASPTQPTCPFFFSYFLITLARDQNLGTRNHCIRRSH